MAKRRNKHRGARSQARGVREEDEFSHGGPGKYAGRYRPMRGSLKGTKAMTVFMWERKREHSS